MKTSELKTLTNTRTVCDAVTAIYSRLDKRNWRINGAPWKTSGIEYKTQLVHFTRIESIPGGASFERIKLPLDQVIDCVSGIITL
jgi:hypothetical protein